VLVAFWVAASSGSPCWRNFLVRAYICLFLLGRRRASFLGDSKLERCIEKGGNFSGYINRQHKAVEDSDEGDDYSWPTKGFSISSEPSTGLSRVIVGPRRTARPRGRV